MFVLAVTGGIGAGKSAAAAFFARRGAFVADLDDIAKRSYEPGGPAYQAVVDAFGDSVTEPDGRVSHDALARAAFTSTEASQALGRAVHPSVTQALSVTLDELALAADPYRVVVLEIPLLVEVPEILEMVDHVLVIEASEDVRRARLAEKGMLEQDVARRMALQSTEGQRSEIADAVIRNEGDIQELEARLAEFWDREVVPRVT